MLVRRVRAVPEPEPQFGGPELEVLIGLGGQADLVRAMRTSNVLGKG